MHRVKANPKTQKVALILESEKASVEEVVARLGFLGFRVEQGLRREAVEEGWEQQERSHELSAGVAGRPVRTAWISLCNLCTTGTSVICMGSMGAAAVAAGAAGATSVAGMAGMGGMAATGNAAEAQAASTAPFLTLLLEQVGLGFFNQVPDAILRPIFIILLFLSVGTAYGGFRTHGRPQPFLLTGLSGALLYGSIYVWMSEPFYYVGFTGMLGAALWGLILAKSAGEAAPNDVAASEEGGAGC